MAGWNDTFDGTLDWSANDFYGMFVAAMKERDEVLESVFNETTDYTPYQETCEIGDDVQFSGSQGSRAPGNSGGSTTITTLQQWMEYVCSCFAPQSMTLTAPPYYSGRNSGGNIVIGPTPDPFTYTLGTWRLAAGINSAGFRRKRPREIQRTTDTTDVMGNTAITGQLAYANPPLMVGYDTISGMLYRFSGSAWVIADQTLHADVLDSTAAAPDNVPYGTMAKGDYIGDWLFTQMRDGFNQLTRITTNGALNTVPSGGIEITALPSAAFDDQSFVSALWGEGPVTTNDSTGSDTSWAAAIADATSHFTVGGELNSYVFSELIVDTDGTFDGTNYTATATAVRWGYGAWFDDASTPTINCDLYFYASFDLPAAGGTFHANDVTDYVGAPPSAGATALLEKQAMITLPTAGIVLGTRFFGDAGGGHVKIPDFNPIAPTGMTDEFYGYLVNWPRFIADFQVSGGFAYTSSTP